MSRRKKTLGLGLLLVTATSIPALAQQPAGAAAQPYAPCTRTVSTNESEIAHARYIAGKADYDEGNYTSAIRRFRDAYNIDCTKHELLIIISAAYERNGDKKEAITALETYVSRAPSAPDVPTYQAKIENLKKQLAATPPPTASAAPTPAPTSSGDVQEHTPYPWIAVGVGGAAIAAGIVVVVTTPALPPNSMEGSEECTRLPNTSDQDFADQRDQAGKHVDQPRVGFILVGAGAVLAAGGLVWHFLEPTGPKESSRTKLRPSVAPGYAGLSLGGTF